MKKLSVIIFYWTFLTLFVFSQYFRVSKENNWRDTQSNWESTRDVERLLFGDFNAPVKFFYAPSLHRLSGFRIVRDSLNSSYILEVKYISNSAEATGEARKRHPTIGLENPFVSTEEVHRHNREAIAKQRELRLQLLEVETLSFSISQLFFEKLQEKKKTLISTFEEENSSFLDPICSIFNEVEIEEIVFIGSYYATFRTVVDDVVWSLWVSMPRNRALEFSNLFRQMIEDAKVGEFDEERYMEILSAM